MSRLSCFCVYHYTTTVAYSSIVQHVSTVSDDVAVVEIDSIQKLSYTVQYSNMKAMMLQL